MTSHVVHTIAPGAGVPRGYFDEDNVTYILQCIDRVLSREFKQRILIDRASIIRTMQYILSERREAIPRMNQRVVMYVCNDFRTSQNETRKHLNWEAGYVQSQSLVDNIGQTTKFDQRAIKLTDTPKYDGQTKVGSTLRFYFT